MPWLETSPMEQRIEFLRAVESKALRFRALCRVFGISPKTGYKWLKRFREAGSATALADRSRRPRRSPRRTSEVTEARIVELRRRYGWGGEKLHVLLADEGLVVSPSTIDRVIRRHGLVDPEDVHPRATKRFERTRPNELWQMDFKGDYPVAEGGRCYPLSILDDHSRYLLRLAALSSTDGGGVQRQVLAAFEQYGMPDAMLMDHGSPWWSTSNGWGLTRFSVGLIDQGIRLIFGAVAHPQTQGKVERFHRTLKRSLRQRGVPSDLAGFAATLEAFRQEYNEIRPHHELGLRPPASRYRPSARSYAPDPPRWEYPEGADVRRIDGSGGLGWNGRWYFVCEALTGRDVWCRPMGSLVWVTYRHMQIREINLETQRTTPLVRPQPSKALPMS